MLVIVDTTMNATPELGKPGFSSVNLWIALRARAQAHRFARPGPLLIGETMGYCARETRCEHLRVGFFQGHRWNQAIRCLQSSNTWVYHESLVLPTICVQFISSDVLIASNQFQQAKFQYVISN